MSTWELRFYDRLKLGTEPVRTVTDNNGVFEDKRADPGPGKRAEGSFTDSDSPSESIRTFDTVDLYYGNQCQLRLRFEGPADWRAQVGGYGSRSLTISGPIANRLVSSLHDFQAFGVNQDPDRKKHRWVTVTIGARDPKLSVRHEAIGSLQWSMDDSVGLINGPTNDWRLKSGANLSERTAFWQSAPTSLFARHVTREDQSWRLIYPASRAGTDSQNLASFKLGMFVERRAADVISERPDKRVPTWRLVLLRQLEYSDDDRGSWTGDDRPPTKMQGDLVWERSYRIHGPALGLVADSLPLHSHAMSFGVGDVQLTQALPWVPIENDEPDLYTFGVRAASVRSKAVAFGADDVLDAWQGLVAGQIQASLRTTKGGENFSLIPVIHRADGLPQSALTWQVLCEASAIAGKDCEPLSPLRFRAQAVDSDMPIEAVALEFPGLRDHDGAPTRMLADLQPARDGWGGDAKSTFHFRLQAQYTGGDNRPIAIGALDLTLDSNRQADLQLCFAIHALDGRNHLLSGALCNPRNHALGAVLPLAALVPASMDSVPDEITAAARAQSRSMALVVAEPLRGNYSLSVSERYTPGSNRDFHALLSRSDFGGESGAPDSTNASECLIFDPAPCFIARVDVGTLANADVKSNQFAAFESGADGVLQWRYRFSSPATKWTLPPQAIGEAYVYRVEIGDRELVDYRLGMHGRLELPNDSERQAFALLPTNWRHVHGYPGQSGPGTRLDSAVFELLYGLEVTLAGRGLRLVEHGAERGRPASAWPCPRVAGNARPDEDETDCALLPTDRRYWNTLRDRIRHRLAALEVRLDDQRSLPLQPEAASQVRVRDDADLAEPPPLPIPTEAQAENASSPSGLKGALYWPIRSANLRALLAENDGRSSSGRLNRVALTALGGYGEQLARFAGDRLGIETRTSQGRVSFHAVEVIGRIGSFWNRAKYVVIYERTVGRRQRYAPDSPEAQSALRGRAVVRKVAEFVEILELDRRYPDLGGAAADAGPVRGLRFRSARIPVSDQWSREIGKIGWAVPLWRPPVDPAAPTPYERLFPKPQVSVALADSRGEEFWADIDDPDNLVFFAYTRPGANDRTDNWPSISGIDRVEGPLPAIPQRWDEKAAGNAAELDRPSPLPADVLPRFAPCTWRLAPAAAQADLLAGRTTEPVGAVIDVITMMRGLPSATTPAADRLADAPALIADLIRDAHAQAWALRDADPAQLRERIRTELLKRLSDATGLDARQWLEPKRWKQLVDSFDEMSSPCALLIRAATQAIESRSDAWKGELLQLRDRVIGTLEPFDIVRAKAIIDETAEAIDSASLAVERGLSQGRSALDAYVLAPLEQHLTRGQDLVAELHSGLAAARARLQADLRADRESVLAQLREWQRRLAAIGEQLLARSDAVLKKLESSAKKPLEDLASELRPQWTDLRDALRPALMQSQKAIDAAAAASGDALRAFEQAFNAIEATADVLRAGVDGTLRDLRVQLEVVAGNIDASSGGIRDAIRDFRLQSRTRLAELKTQLNQNDPRAQVEVAWSNLLSTWDTKVVVPVQQVTSEFIRAQICPLLPTADDLKSLLNPLQTVLEKLRDGANDLLTAIDAAVDKLDAGLDGLRAQAERLLERFDQALERAGETALRLLRAVGRPPELPGLSFNLPRIEFRFNPDLPRVDITPLTSYFAQAGDYLKSLGLRLPTVSLGGAGFEMPDLPKLPFDLNAVLPDFSGIKLDGLFDKIKLPKDARKQIKVTHGIDKQRRIAWAQADVDMPLGGARKLFSAASVEVRLLDPRFIARSRLEIDQRGRSRLQSDGRLEGDIQLLVAGTSLVRMVDCQICFDDSGDFDFKFDPQNLKFDGVMLFLSDLMKRIPGSDSPFFPELLERDGRPYGIETRFDLAPPDLQFGTFGISGMQIQMRLRLTIEDGGLFRIGTFVALGSPEKPFTITVFILGGSGWVDLTASYLPARREVTSMVSVALGASATLAIRFGPIAGHVQIFFGIRANFSSGRGGFSIAALLILNGGVVIFGFVRIGLHVRLEIEYRSNGALIGHGVVALEIRISRFFKRKVRQRIRQEFKRGRQAAAAQVNAAALPAAKGAVSIPAVAPDEFAARVHQYRANRV